MLGLIRSLVSKPHHYFAELPYNLNWAISGRDFDSFLRENPLNIVDIGARGGPLPEISGLRNYINYVAFDADAVACARLNERPPPGFRSFSCFPEYIGGAAGNVKFHVFERGELSSPYPQSERYRVLFASAAEQTIKREVELPSITLDAALRAYAATAPDLLKLDTQGSELDILRGAPQVAETAFLIEIEVEFLEVYQGQPLFADVHQFLTSIGFELLYLNRVFQQRRNLYSGPARGQLTFGDALYGRTESSWSRFSAEALAKYAILLLNYGHHDIAYQVSLAQPEILKLCPGLARHLHRGRPSFLRRALVAQFDKLLCLGLHLRKFNGMRTESDRSWPVR